MSFRASAVLIALFFIAMHALVLPPDGFVTGDQGSKFLQARAFADHGPLDPSIDVLARDIDPQYHRQEPKLKNRRGRLVSEFLWLLPLMTAPFLHVLGLRGLYVVPALSVLAIFGASAALGRKLGDPTGLRTAWTVLLVTPVVLYGLELWEHAPATTCVLLAALWLAPDASSGEPTASGSHSRFLAAGAAIAVGALFREEVVPALPALLIARALVMNRDRFTDLIEASAWSSIGAFAVFAASVPVNMTIYGAPLPMHMTQDAWEVAKNTPYMQVRREIVVDLLLPASHTALFVAAVVAAFGASMWQALRGRRTDAKADAVSRRLLAVVHVAAIVILVIAVVLPLWRLATGVWPHLSYRFSSAAHTWLFVLAISYWPWIGKRTTIVAARYLVVSAAVLFVGTFLLVPTSGGSQWSPRFMLPVAPLLGMVAANIWRESSARNRNMAGVILLASSVMTATGIVVLSRAKVHNAEMTHRLAARTAPGEVLISNVFWFPELTATLAPTRRYLFSWSARDVPQMAAMAIARGLPRFSLVTSLPLTGYDAPAVLDVPGAPCRYARGLQVGLDPYGLTLSRYGCEGPEGPGQK